MKLPNQAQTDAATAAFLKEIRLVSDEELRDARFLEGPIFYALRAAEEVRPKVIQNPDDVARETGKMSFKVDAWSLNGTHLEETVAASTNLGVARAAFEAAKFVRRTSRITLRHGARVVEEYHPDDTPLIPVFGMTSVANRAGD